MRETAVATPEGFLTVRPGGRLINGRVRDIGHALLGTPAAEAPKLVRRLMPVCGWAQAVACQRAVESATGSHVARIVENSRERLLQAEAATAMLWRFWLDWQPLADAPPKPEPVRKARTQLEQIATQHLLLNPDSSGQGTGLEKTAAGAADLAGMLKNALVDVPDKPEDFKSWISAAKGTPARLIQRASQLVSGPAMIERPQLAAPAAIAGRLAVEPGFGAAPHHNGNAKEFGAWTLLDRAILRELEKYGPIGLRFLAMILQMRQVVEELESPLTDAEEPIAGSDDWGAGSARTSRGPLVHRIAVSKGRVTGFQSVAPTEWLIHPQGALTRCLKAIGQDACTKDIELVCTAFDPCAPVHVQTRELADA